MKIKNILNSEPTGDAILVSMKANEDNYSLSKGGIIINNDSVTHRLVRCRVEKIGAGIMLADGTNLPIPLEIGDIVVVERPVGILFGIQDDGRDYRVIRYKNVVLKIDKDVNEDGVDEIGNDAAVLDKSEMAKKAAPKPAKSNILFR